MDPRELGVRLTRYRQRLQLSMTQLANQSGVDYMQISRYEKGQTLLSLDMAVRLPIVLKVSLDELVTETHPPAPPMLKNKRLLERMREPDQLPAHRQAMALRVLDPASTAHE